jgi:catechol 2,3-dioxygenase-like lactoylglutathione lyase family enzyme
MLSDGLTGASLAVTDMVRARAFYADTLGFPVARESEGGILFQGGGGSAFFVYPSTFAGTNKATSMGINVADFDAVVTELRGKGVAFIDYDFDDFKTDNGVVQTPEGPAAWFADPDGNIIGLTQM